MKRLIADVNQLHQVLDAIANGITVQDPSGQLIFVNAAAARMMGCASPEEAVRLGGAAIMARFKLYDETGHPIDVRSLPGRQALAGRNEPSMTVGFTSEDQLDIRWTSIKAMPVLDSEGKVSLSVNVLQDITELKEAERRLQDANERITKLLEQALIP